MVVNARLGLNGNDRKWQIEAWAQNLFNEQYTQVAFNGHGDDQQATLQSLQARMPTGTLNATGTVGWAPGLNWDIAATLAQVSEWAGIPLEQLNNRFQQDRRKVKPFEPILLLNDMSFEQVARIEAQLMYWPGLEIVTRSKRHYPEGKEFAHILGYVAEANEQEPSDNA